MDSFKGKYQRVSAEKYEEFLKALDVSFMLRKAATVSTPVMEVSEEEESGRSRPALPSRPWNSSSRLVKNLTRIHLMAEVTAKVTLEDNKFICEQKAKKPDQKKYQECSR